MPAPRYIRPCPDPDLRLVAEVVTEGVVVLIYESARRYRERTASDLRRAVLRLLPAGGESEEPGRAA